MITFEGVVVGFVAGSLYAAFVLLMCWCRRKAREVVALSRMRESAKVITAEDNRFSKRHAEAERDARLAFRDAWGLWQGPFRLPFEMAMALTRSRLESDRINAESRSEANPES